MFDYSCGGIKQEDSYCQVNVGVFMSLVELNNLTTNELALVEVAQER